MNRKAVNSIPSVVAAVVLWIASAGSARSADNDEGGMLYKKQCASCHGSAGEGTKRYPMRLEGDRSVKQLAAYISKTMPEDNPGSCTGENAERVAAYMHDSFYSPVARERNRPPRVELARLTVQQHRNALADLIASFRGPPRPIDNRRGLKGEYYSGRNANKQAFGFERIDRGVDFDFGIESPDFAKVNNAHEFNMVWSGSVIPPDSGNYEIIIKSDHSFRVWVNDPDVPLIDGYVRSGKDVEFRATVPLLEGRTHPIRLQFSKAKQGVNDKKAKETPPKPAQIRLWWRAPKGVEEPIPARCLVPIDSAPVFVARTPFPPDDRSLGWERGSTVSREWDQATTDAAFETAAYVVLKLNALAKTTDSAADRESKVREFCRQFVERAFRRPPTDDIKGMHLDRPFAGSKDLESAVKRVVLFALKSPRFLYREPPDADDGYSRASRLSFALWDSIPDSLLTEAASKGELAQTAGLSKHAERMMADPRTRTKIRRFFHHWLNVDHAGELTKDPKAFAGFTPAVAADLRTSLDLTVEEAVWGGKPDFRAIMTSDELQLNKRLADFYKANGPKDSEFMAVKLDAGKRSGILSHPYLLASFAYNRETSPIHRGVFLTRGVMGLGLKPPTEAVVPVPAELHPTLTTRERVSLQTKAQACMTCHDIINPLGFTLEQFDAVGRYREKDNNKPVNADGFYLDRDGKRIPIRGAVELAKFAAGSAEVHQSFVEQLFQHLWQQPVRAYGSSTVDALYVGWKKNDFDVRKLVVETAVRGAAVPRTVKSPTGKQPAGK